MSVRSSILLALLGLCGGASESWAEEKAKKYALLIGVNRYDHAKLPTLKFAVNDAIETGEVLEKHQYEVTYLTDTKGKSPTKANIEATINELLEKFKSGDTLIIGLAGHGMQFKELKDCFFCPKDAKPFPDETKTMVSLGSIWSRLEKTYSGTKLVMIDACRDDGSGIRGGTETIPLPPKGVGVLLSCSDGQFAREHDSLKHGVFFHHVIEGLKGAAKDSDNEVTWDRLREYVKKGVPKKLLEIYGEDSGVKQDPNEMGNLTGVPFLVKFAGGTTPKIEVDTHKAGEEREFSIAKGVKVKFCWIPAEKGTAGFWLGKYEVTQEEWEQVMGENPSHFSARGEGKDSVPENTAKFPVENVSWDDCQQFLQRMNNAKLETGTFALPTQAEWQFAALGKQSPVPELTKEVANFSTKATRSVDSLKSTHPWNLYQMAGNVAEWAADGPTSGKNSRYALGGNYSSSASDCQITSTRTVPKDFPTPTIGLRLVFRMR